MGATDDTAIPPRVRVRVWLRDGGVCRECGRKVSAGEAWELDHVVALVNGGEHRESNLAVVHPGCHRDKTRRDVKEKAKVERVRKRHLGIKPKSRMPGSKSSRWKRKMDGTLVLRNGKETE